jgi:uncharacterized short protein YbdD (DUF466 family)
MSRGIDRDAGCGVRDAAPPLLTRVARVARRVIGAPDYGMYLEHCRAAGHPPQLTEREYVDQFFKSKGKGVRCC